MPDLALTAAGRLDGSTPQQKVRQAAKAFEQQFVAQLLKPLTESGDDEEKLFGNDPGTNAFRGLLVDGLAENASGSLGVAKIIEQAMAARIRPATP
jgi:Rod binding domain-containing protein